MRDGAVGVHSREAAITGVSAVPLGAVCLGMAAPNVDLNGPVMCPFRLATGLPCPFCGMTRSLVALGQGRLDASFDLSPLGPFIPLVALAAGAAAMTALARGRAARWPPWVLALGALLLAGSWGLQLARVTG
jgi:hypothetical protein